MPHKVKSDQLVGFDLIGYREPDGSILLGADKIPMANFPQEVEILGITFALEEVLKNDLIGSLESDHPGKTIEWGRYA